MTRTPAYVYEEARYFLVKYITDDLGLLYTHGKQLCAAPLQEHAFWPQKPDITAEHILSGLRSDWMPRNAVPVIYTCEQVDFNTMVSAMSKFGGINARLMPSNYKMIALGSIFSSTEIHELLEHVRLRDTLLELNT